MSNNIAIKVENLSKRYRIGLEEQRHDTFGGVITSWIKSPFLNFKRLRQLSKFAEKDDGEDIIWALRDLSFEVKHGEVIGIIGRNGAGKSTLLKIISRITEPTSGRIVLNGSVSSLLEVGTGFHPELTGRENVYLNGTILGMKKAEVDRNFDEIVDFSGVEKFIDTPVKRYSSGMRVRLAFAVAAHLEPEILLVDEVLAVGDVEFQKKCLGKMQSITGEGKTVLFVSHNMNSIKRLCTTAILLNDGKIEYAGSANSTIHKYLNESINQNTIWENNNYNNKCNYLKPLSLYACDEYGNIIQNSVSRNDRLSIVFEFDLKIKQRDLTIGVSVFDENNQHLFRTLHADSNENINEELKVGNNKIICELPKGILNEGTYLIKLDGGIYKQSWDFNPFTDDDISIKIEIIGNYIFSKYWQNKRAGILAPKIQWKVE